MDPLFCNQNSSSASSLGVNYMDEVVAQLLPADSHLNCSPTILERVLLQWTFGFLCASGACHPCSWLGYCVKKSPADATAPSCPAWPGFRPQRTRARGLSKPTLHVGSPVACRGWFLPRARSLHLLEMLRPSSRRQFETRKAAIYPETYSTKHSTDRNDW